MLYSKDRHVDIRSASWNSLEVLEFAHQIMVAADNLLNDKGVLPAHSLDSEKETGSLPTMYYGVEGVAWGLHYWSRLTNFQLKIDPLKILENRIIENKEGPSYFFGTTGIRVAIQAIRSSEDNLKLLKDDLVALQSSQTNEMMAGAPGALIASQFLSELCPDKWISGMARELIVDTLSKWEFDKDLKLPVWHQKYGEHTSVYVGAAHGAVGNIFTLLRSGKFLTKEEKGRIQKTAMDFLKQTAIQNETEANWPAVLPREEAELLHWCHGAPGIVMLLATLLPVGADSDFDKLLVKAGNLIWNAGPLKKGASLCHGTAGSGAALLKLYERTGDELWLNRARALAMAVMDQVKKDKGEFKQLRYSLWTGDIGVALFLHSCTTGRFMMPMLDVI